MTIDFTSEELTLLEKRAKKNLMSVRELVDDIVRRSMVYYKKNKGKSTDKFDDALIGVFSRARQGGKRRSKK